MMRAGVAYAFLLLLAACSSSGPGPKPPAPGVKVGKPYTIDGVTYTPRVQEDYDEIGTASWYGPGFHGKYTANGETYNQDDITAAHTTLPLPSIVRVTNLENGRSALVRVNDRGPFKDRRIIDLSRGSAQKLGITGLARVRVQYLKQETETYWANNNLNGPLVPPGIGMPEPVEVVAEAESAAPAPIMSVSSNDLPAAPGKPGVHVSTVMEEGIEAHLPDEAPAGEGTVPPPQEVASAEFAPPTLEIRPIQPRFSVVSDANAQERATVSSPFGQPSAPLSSDELGAYRPAVQETDSPRLRGDAGGNAASSDAMASTASPLNPPLNPPASGGTYNGYTPAGGGADGGYIPAGGGTSAPMGKGSFYIQAGSFASGENAYALATRLQQVAEAHVSEVEAGGRFWHRVRVGPAATRGEAESLLRQVVQQGVSDARIVRD